MKEYRSGHERAFDPLCERDPCPQTACTPVAAEQVSRRRSCLSVENIFSVTEGGDVVVTVAAVHGAYVAARLRRQDCQARDRTSLISRGSHEMDEAKTYYEAA